MEPPAEKQPAPGESGLPAAAPEARPIGVFDSGVGGLTVARSIIDQLPNESILYVGIPPTGRTGRSPSRRCGPTPWA